MVEIGKVNMAQKRQVPFYTRICDEGCINVNTGLLSVLLSIMLSYLDSQIAFF